MLTYVEKMLASWPAVVSLMALFVASQAWIILALGDTGKELAKLQTVCLVNPGSNSTGAAARVMLEEWTSVDIQNFRRHFLLDFYFHPIIYALFFTSALLYNLNHDKRTKDNPRAVVYGRIGTVSIFCGGLCDILENVRHSSIEFDSDDFASDDVLWEACVFASTKWVIMGAVTGWLSWRCFLNPEPSIESSPSKSIHSTTSNTSTKGQGLDNSWVGPRSQDFLNAPCEAGLLTVQGRRIPWTLSAPDSRHDNERSYTVSPYAHYIGYALDEIKIHLETRPLLAFVAETIVKSVGLVFSGLGFDSSIYFNNLLISTNLWPTTIQWSEDQIDAVNLELLSQATKANGDSQRAIVWKSVDSMSQPILTKALMGSPSCVMIPGRVVNWSEFEGNFVQSDLYKKKDFQRDLKLFRKQVGWDIIRQDNWNGWETSKYRMMTIQPEGLTMVDATCIVDLFRQLYISKYSKRNPQLTPEGLIRMGINGYFRVDVLRLRKREGNSSSNDDGDSSLGRIVGFCTWSTVDDVTNSSFVGYDIGGDTDKELYRLVMMMIHNNLVESGRTKCHMSGGANRFKRRRGARSAIEYNAVFVDHLPFYQQIPWKLTKLIADKIITVDRAK